MEKWNNPKQPFSLTLLLVVVTVVIISFFIAVFITYWGADSVLIGSLIKAIIVFIVFWILFYIQAKISHPIHDEGYVFIIGLIAFFIIFSYPVYLEIQNPLFDPSNYQYQTFPGSGQGSQGNLYSYIFFRGVQFVILAMAIIGGVLLAFTSAYSTAYGQDTTLYSQKYEKFYKKVYSTNYNVYINDYLENLSKTLNFNTVIQFLNDSQRFQQLPKVKQQNFSVFNLPEDEQIIIILHDRYLLSREESALLSNVIQKNFIKSVESDDKIPHNSGTVNSRLTGGDFTTEFSGSGEGEGIQQKSKPQPGADLLMRIQIRHEDVLSGVDRDIEVMHTEPCPVCNGSGSETKQSNICPRCGGAGQMRQATCNRCGGKGKIPEKFCKECRGSGHSRVKRKLSIHIPAGIKNGMRLRVKGYGEAGDYGVDNGDLFIEVNVP